MPMYTLYLDAGHTKGKDPGAVALGTTEQLEVAQLVQKTAALLDLPEWQIVIVPGDLLLPQKIAWINARASHEDVLVSVHMNSAGNAARGMEVYYFGGSDASLDRAERLHAQIAATSPLFPRGVRDDRKTRHNRLGIIRDTHPWAFLIEYGFLTSAMDLDVVRRRGPEDLAMALTAWLTSW